ncbi:MAG: 8-amino-7-oxononanoate synthase [Gammaproteobacteria bacterium]|nr:8-amino-7-oxononanoate synthase [Gammaproteobacteria bacterium]
MPALSAALAALDDAGLRRRRRTVERIAPDSAAIRVDGRDCLDFCGNDYLGLAGDPRLAEAAGRAANASGVGARASHLVCGHQPEHAALEAELAAWTGRERTLVFSTGYQANLGLVTALAGRGTRVHEDRLNHASLIDAALLAGARLQRYAHADAVALERHLAARAGTAALVLTDGVFSMDGDVAPLPALAAACARHGALLAVDDAHGLGVLGASGRGTLEHFALGQTEVPALVGTFGKAFGTFGAFVAGPAPLIESLVQRARSYVYTTALPPPIVAATRTALALAAAEPWRRERALALAQRFRARAQAAGLRLVGSATPIQPVLIGAPDAAVNASAALLERGFFVAAIRPPTVPAGTSRLRVTLSALHREADVDALVMALADCGPQPMT